MGQNNQGRRLIFGPTMDCTIEVRPAGTPGAVAGLLLRDPSGIRILNPVSNGNHRIVFGPTDDCRIDVVPAGTAGAGMRVLEPRGVLFTTPTGGATQVTVNGPVNAQAFIQTSSRRFKHDVKPIEQPLEKIGKLQGVRFTWNEEKGGARDIGFIAEEVAKVVPELVAWEEDGKNARGVNYAQLVAVTVEGIKEQQTRIERQQAAINSLKDENAALQDRLERLEKLVGDLSTVKTTAQQDHEH